MFLAGRDFAKKPYTPDEMRIVNWLMKMSQDMVGGGDDPIGFFMASYEELIHERKDLRLANNALKLDNERLANIQKFDKAPDLAEDAYQNARAYAETKGN